MRRIISVFLSAVLTVAFLASCASTPKMTFSFVEEVIYETYTNKVEGSAMTIYVDANAADGGNGSEKAPFKTIPEAQAKIRELKAGEGLPTGGITVLVKDGEYRLSESLAFTEEDSGTAECPITYVSESEFGATLTGGVILSADDFEPLNEDEKSRLIDSTAKDKVVKVDLTKYGMSPEIIETIGSNAMELFIDGERSVLARYPNEDFTRTKDVIFVGDTHETFTDINFDRMGDAVVVPGFDYAVNNRGGIFTVSDEVLQRVSKWSAYEDIYAQGYFKWSWSVSTTLFGDINTRSGQFTLANAVSYGVSKGAPFYFLNVYDEIDMPGEFFIDKATGTLYVYKTDNFDSAEIMISSLQGNAVNVSGVSHLNFKGFSFCATRAGGLSYSGSDAVIENCKIYNVRGTAVSLSGMNITIQNCEICNVGAAGITASGGNASELIPSGILIHNNYIHDYAVIQRTYQSAVSVGGCGVTVSHNEVCNAPHMAMGWGGPLHVIEYNEVYNVCTETGDCGALYNGRTFNSYGCVIRYNYIHDVGHGSVHAHAIYWDDGLSGQTAYGNIMVNTSSYALLSGGGRDNVIENNIIINPNNHGIAYDNRARYEVLDPEDCWFTHDEEMANAMVANRNDIWNEAFPTYGKLIPWYEGYTGDVNDPFLSANPANNSVKNNVTYYFNGDTSVQRKMYNKHNIHEDIYLFSDVRDNPIFMDYIADFPGWYNGDYTLKENSRLKEVCPDFELIPLDKIGRIK